MSSPTQDELRRTQQYLAEVIDECVFVERQRELMERRLTLQINNQREIIDETLGALEHMCCYTSCMERAIFPSVLASLPPSSPSRQELLHARSDVEARLSQLVKTAQLKGEDSFHLSPLTGSVQNGQATKDTSFTAQTSSSSPPLQSPAVGAEILRGLCQLEADLFDALAKAAARINATQLRASSENGELQALRTRMDELTRVVEASAEKPAFGPLAALPSSLPPSAETAKEKDAHGSSSSTIRLAQARVLAYEKTTQALNNELALLHENYAALSRASALEIDRLEQKNAEAQRKHDDQVAECDAVLGRLSLELEQLIRENAQLKQRMRALLNTDG